MQLSDIEAFFQEKQNNEISLPRAIRLNDGCKLVCHIQEQNSTASLAIPVTIDKQHSISVFDVDSFHQTVNFKVEGILPAGSAPHFWFQIPFGKLAKILKWEYSK